MNLTKTRFGAAVVGAALAQGLGSMAAPPSKGESPAAVSASGRVRRPPPDFPRDRPLTAMPAMILMVVGLTEQALRAFAKRAKKEVERRDFEESFPGWFDARNLPENLKLLSRLLDEPGLQEAEFRVLEAVARLHDLSHFPWLLPYEGPQHRPETRNFVLQSVTDLHDLEALLLGLEEIPEDSLLSSAHAFLRLDGETNQALANHIGALLLEKRERFHVKWIALYSVPPGRRCGTLRALYLVSARFDHSTSANKVAALDGIDRRWNRFEGGSIMVTKNEGEFRVEVAADSKTLQTQFRSQSDQERMVADVRRVLGLPSNPI